MTYTPFHVDWEDYPSEDTPITAAALEHIEQGIVEAHDAVAEGLPSILSYGATGDGSTDDTTALQDALDEQVAVYFPPGDYKVTAELTPKSKAKWFLAPDATILYTGSGKVFENDTAAGFVEFEMHGGAISAASATHVFHFHSAQRCVLRDLLVTAATTTVVLTMEGDGTANDYDGSLTLKNTIWNRIGPLTANKCGTLLDLSGDDDPDDAYCTLNTFTDLEGVCYSDGIKLGAFVDNNSFVGVTRIELKTNSTSGVIVNSSATPTAESSVYSNRFDHLAIDAFGVGSGRKGLVLNHSRFTIVGHLFLDPEPEGGGLVDNNSQSHYCLARVDTLETGMILYSKGVKTYTESRWTDPGGDYVQAVIAPSAASSAIVFGSETDHPILFTHNGSESFRTRSGGGLLLGGSIAILSGSGTPEGAVTAPVGSIYLRSDGGASTTLYVKQSGSGNTGWVAK